MNFYIITSIVLTILLLFSVGESIAKSNNVNRYFLIAFLILSAICFCIPPISIFGYLFNPCYFIYLFAFIYMISKIRSFKDLFKTIFLTLIILAVCVCYNAINTTKFEYAFVQPYLFVAFLLGCVCIGFSQKEHVVFSSFFLGVTLSEVISKDIFLLRATETFMLGENRFACIMLMGILGFAIAKQIVCVVLYFKNKRNVALNAKQS